MMPKERRHPVHFVVNELTIKTIPLKTQHVARGRTRTKGRVVPLEADLQFRWEADLFGAILTSQN